MHLVGLRGWFTIQSFLFVFFDAFLPGTVVNSYNNQGPLWQMDLRKSLGVLFWNGPLIYSAFILLSARSIAIPFLRDPSKANLTGAIFRRGLRLFFPALVGLGLAKLILAQTDGYAWIQYFLDLTGNESASVPYDIPNALVYFNAVFNLFWITRTFATSAASLAFPSHLLWILTVLYTQSFTVYMTMIVAPYTRPAWRLKAALFFVLSAWWMQSWAWYSISGLLLADMVVNMDFQQKAARGIPLPFKKGLFLPSWTVYLLLMLGGVLMQFLWTGWNPQLYDSEIVAHAGLYYSGGLNTDYDSSQPQARDDIYLILLGFLLAVDTYPWLQRLFANPVFVYLGSRSLSWLFAQGIVVYTAGMRLFIHLNVDRQWPSQVSVFVSFLVSLLTVIAFAELFYRLVDHPSRAFSHIVFDWIRE
ncbi:hypothetical protein ASPZODRAFT_29195 [Penicilliopsis zonata CBS 506.65]|uniref:Acyltransferase 3 domain-containing protein n=1 Tax=Penicilliopsis zonata CBS 506.65 TaxID=1073090 RepID=A0A1L9S5L9_9EURO|nr:hypothetical protein ASPZODRAFT_29195 [Penicilliopsis zonata CBS 506.65]OJJ42466.1 hypothetical protein ASPZODRAFT_29195 [Penicilliopsis zonata CBS 506.65]